MAIERFEYENGGHGPSKFYKSPSGSLVRFSDYSMLALENDSLRAANARLQAWHDAVMGQKVVDAVAIGTAAMVLRQANGRILELQDAVDEIERRSVKAIIRPQPLAKE